MGIMDPGIMGIAAAANVGRARGGDVQDPGALTLHGMGWYTCACGAPLLPAPLMVFTEKQAIDK